MRQFGDCSKSTGLSELYLCTLTVILWILGVMWIFQRLNWTYQTAELVCFYLVFKLPRDLPNFAHYSTKSKIFVHSVEFINGPLSPVKADILTAEVSLTWLKTNWMITVACLISASLKRTSVDSGCSCTPESIVTQMVTHHESMQRRA